MAMFHTAPHLYLSPGVSVSCPSFPATQPGLCLTSFLSFLSAATIDALSLTLWKRPSPFHCFDWKRHQHCSCHLNSPHLFLFLWGALRSSPQNSSKKSPIPVRLTQFCSQPRKLCHPQHWWDRPVKTYLDAWVWPSRHNLAPDFGLQRPKIVDRRLLTQEAALVEKC